MPDTESIDRLFLELSQFTRATTGRELKLIAALREVASITSGEAGAAHDMQQIAVKAIKEDEKLNRPQ